MTRPVAVIRPEPGNTATADRATALGFDVIRLPLFAVRRVAWLAPDPADHDALLLTSASAVRHAGPQLERLRELPVLAVGAATATAARLAGFDVTLQGTQDASRLLRQAERQGFARALHLAGRERTVSRGGAVSAIITVYASDPVTVSPDALSNLSGSVVLVHSARAGARLAELIDHAGRAAISIAAISSAAAAATGDGWHALAIACSPDDDAVLEAARTMANSTVID